MSILKKLGPGLLYAAAAVGVSHLVQSQLGKVFGRNKNKKIQKRRLC